MPSSGEPSGGDRLRPYTKSWLSPEDQVSLLASQFSVAGTPCRGQSEAMHDLPMAPAAAERLGLPLGWSSSELWNL